MEEEGTDRRVKRQKQEKGKMLTEGGRKGGEEGEKDEEWRKSVRRKREGR